MRLKSFLLLAIIAALPCFQASSYGCIMAVRGYEKFENPEQAYRQVQSDIYHFRFLKAAENTERMKMQFPAHALSYLAEVSHLWWMIITEPDNPHHEVAYDAVLTKAMKQLSSRKGLMSREEQYAFMNLYAFRTRLDVGKGEYIRAARTLKTGMDMLEQTLGLEKEFEPFYLTSGLYMFATDYGCSKYPVLKVYALFFPKGNQKKGLEYLVNGFHSKDKVLKVESAYFLMRIYADVLSESFAAFPYAHWLVKNYGDNLIFQFYYRELLKKVQSDQETPAQYNIAEIVKKNPELSPMQQQYFLNLFSGI